MKARVARQEAESAKQERDLAALSASIASASSRADSASQASASATSTINLVGRALQGDRSAPAVAALHVSTLAFQAISRELTDHLGHPGTTVSVYRQVPAESILRQITNQGPGVTDFSPGKGATGQAFSKREVIVVTGEDVHNATFGLSPEQQEHYATTAIVGAAPLYAADDLSRVIGVVTCSSESEIAPQDLDAVRQQWRDVLTKDWPYFTVYLNSFPDVA